LAFRGKPWMLICLQRKTLDVDWPAEETLDANWPAEENPEC